MRIAHARRHGPFIVGAAVVLTAGLLAACAGSPPPAPVGDDSIRVMRVTRGSAVGFTAIVPLPVAPEAVETWLLDFDHIAPDRPNVVEAALVSEEPDGWLARFRFRGLLGVEPTAVTRTTRRVDGRAVILDFASVETSFGLSGISGRYRIEPDGRGGCVLRHTLFIDTPFVSESARERDMWEDARAIARRFR